MCDNKTSRSSLVARRSKTLYDRRLRETSDGRRSTKRRHRMAIKPANIVLPSRLTSFGGLPSPRMIGWIPGSLVKGPIKASSFFAYTLPDELSQLPGMYTTADLCFAVKDTAAGGCLAAAVKRYGDIEQWTGMTPESQATALVRATLDAEIVGDEAEVIRFIHPAIAALDRVARIATGLEQHDRAIDYFAEGAYLAWHFGMPDTAGIMFGLAIRAHMGLPKRMRVAELIEARGDVLLEHSLIPAAMEDYITARACRGSGEIPPAAYLGDSLDIKAYVLSQLPQHEPSSVGDMLRIFERIAVSGVRKDSKPWHKHTELLTTGDRGTKAVFVRLSTVVRRYLEQLGKHLPGSPTLTRTLRLLMAIDWQELEKRNWSAEYRPLDEVPRKLYADTDGEKKGSGFRIPDEEYKRFLKLKEHYGYNNVDIVASLIVRAAIEEGLVEEAAR